jgi:hypothetical protein
MAMTAKRLRTATLILAAVWAWAAYPVLAQAPPAPGGNPGAPAVQPAGAGSPQQAGMAGLNPGFGGATFGLGSPLPGGLPNSLAGFANALGAARLTSVANNPYGAGSPLTNPYTGLNNPYAMNPYYYSYADPYGGGLKGAAEAINAQGKFEVLFQQARLLNQEVGRSKLDTRRKAIDEWLYERANLPTLQDIRERAQKYELRRALTTPDQPDIVSGYALNTILKDLARRPSLNGAGSLPDIDPNLLKQLNLKPEATAGNVGVLKPVIDGGALNWPLPLQSADFQGEAKRLNSEAAEAVKLVQNTGQADAAVLNNMTDEIRKLRAKVMNRLGDLTETQQVEANRFLNQLDEAVRALQQPNAANYFNTRFAAKGKTAADLVKYMASNGLVFGPASGGDEAAYAAVHNSLVRLANALRDQAETASSTGNK